MATEVCLNPLPPAAPHCFPGGVGLACGGGDRYFSRPIPSPRPRHLMPHNPRQAVRASVAVFVCAWLAGCSGLKPLHQREHALACKECAAGAPCPARPAHFGHYATQWRHWPDADAKAATTSGTSTPAAPPRSVVPRAEEESPRQQVPPPSTATPPADSLGRTTIQPSPTVPGNSPRPDSPQGKDAGASAPWSLSRQLFPALVR